MTGTMPTSLEDLLSGTRVEGVDKTASAQSLPVGQEETAYATELAMLEKFAQDHFTRDDMLKIAASSKISADILSEIQVEKLATAMPVLVKHAMEQALPMILQSILPGLLKEALDKVAIGDSSVRSGNKPADTVEDDPHGQTMQEDNHDNEAGKAKVDAMVHANETVGATGSGGTAESHQGEPTTNTGGSTVGKMASLTPDMLQQLIQARLPGSAGGNITSLEGEKKAMDGMMPGYGPPGGAPGGAPGGDPGGGGEMGPEAILQQLLAKQAQGQPLSPEEMQLLQQLMGAGQGGGGGMPPGAEGGMVREASAQLSPEQKQGLFENLLRSRLG